MSTISDNLHQIFSFKKLKEDIKHKLILFIYSISIICIYTICILQTVIFTVLFLSLELNSTGNDI